MADHAYSTPLRSINVGMPIEVMHRGKPVRTGIFKNPVDGDVAVGPLGLAGDGQADLEAHGGIDKAVYAYTFANVLHWRETLDRQDLLPGSFGENLTLEDLPERAVALGDVLEIGSVRLQVTQPREPCFKLAMKLELPKLPKLFTRSGRVGFYMRVLAAGQLRTGAVLRCVEREADPLSIEALNRAVLIDREPSADLERALASPALSDAWRERIEARLAKR